MYRWLIFALVLVAFYAQAGPKTAPGNHGVGSRYVEFRTDNATAETATAIIAGASNYRQLNSTVGNYVEKGNASTMQCFAFGVGAVFEVTYSCSPSWWRVEFQANLIHADPAEVDYVVLGTRPSLLGTNTPLTNSGGFSHGHDSLFSFDPGTARGSADIYLEPGNYVVLMAVTWDGDAAHSVQLYQGTNIRFTDVTAIYGSAP